MTRNYRTFVLQPPCQANLHLHEVTPVNPSRNRSEAKTNEGHGGSVCKTFMQQPQQQARVRFLARRPENQFQQKQTKEISIESHPNADRQYQCRVLHKGQLSEPFTTQSEVNQGCILSPMLFLIVIDENARHRYTDDVAVLSIAECLSHTSQTRRIFFL